MRKRGLNQENITESSHVHIGLASNATKEQYEAAGLAKFYASLSANQVVLKCHGVQPKVDIPVQIEVIDSFE